MQRVGLDQRTFQFQAIQPPPQGRAVTHQRVDGLSHARLDCHPRLQQSFETVDIELREEQPEG
jgi:hypothetical protein